MIHHLGNEWIDIDIIVVHGPHSWETEHQEGVEEVTYAFWEQLQHALTKRARPHAPFFIVGDANLLLSHAQACYEGIGQHQPAKEATHYAGVFGDLLEDHQLALPCTYRKIHHGQRRIFKTILKHGGPRRLDYIAVPKTWLAATAKSLVLEHFDAYTIIYDHKLVAVEIKGSLISRKALATVPRLDKRWIQSRFEEELNQAVHFTEWQEVPHWTLDQHGHRQDLTRIIHGATEAVTAKKIKPRKPFVTDAIVEVSANRARLIRSKSREEKQATRFDQQRVIAAWKELSHWIAGHRRPTHEPLGIFMEIPMENLLKIANYKCLPTSLAKGVNRKSRNGESRGCPETLPTDPTEQFKGSFEGLLGFLR